jgi:hypothetical protein
MSLIDTWLSERSAALVMTFGGLGGACCLPVIVLNTLMPELRRSPGKFVRFRSLFTLAQTATLIVFAAWTLANPALANSANLCDRGMIDTMLIAAEALETGITLSQFGQALHLLFIVRNPFRPNRHDRKIAGLIWLLTAAEPVGIFILLSHPTASPTSSVPEHCFAMRMSLLFEDAKTGLEAINIVFVVLAIGTSLLLLARLRTGLPVSTESRKVYSPHPAFSRAPGLPYMLSLSAARACQATPLRL